MIIVQYNSILHKIARKPGVKGVLEVSDQYEHTRVVITKVIMY